ncbi:MAG: hypothetical protein AAFZ15_32170 [Bacteroidota bacterium]
MKNIILIIFLNFICINSVYSQERPTKKETFDFIIYIFNEHVGFGSWEVNVKKYDYEDLSILCQETANISDAGAVHINTYHLLLNELYKVENPKIGSLNGNVDLYFKTEMNTSTSSTGMGATHLKSNFISIYVEDVNVKKRLIKALNYVIELNGKTRIDLFKD